ncbi:MAG: acetylornithine transaminase [Clostridia bacterium]|nr:acetylornithine transaminase [Clostridia bacterium]
MSNENIKRLGEKYLMNTYARYPVALTKGEGVNVWDADGKKYMDFVGGLAVNSLGHCYPGVARAVSKQCNEIIHCSNLYCIEKQAKLAELLVKNSSMDRVFFSNSGAEANEAAIKLARRYAQLVLKSDKYKIITMNKSFHGRTIATATATAQEKIHSGFDPLPQGFVYVPFNDIAALRESMDHQVCAVMLEPVQGEGGVNVADKGYLKEVKELCDEKGALLIFDEIQCGLGRTGKMFAYEHYGIKPHILTLAKALGGGIPIGAALAVDGVAEAFDPGSHGSTFGGNPVSCAAGVAVMEALETEGVLENALEIGGYFKEKLQGLESKYDFIKEVRGMGLMLGMELDIPGGEIVNLCMEKGLLINCTSERVLRFLPPLTINRKHVDRALGILEEVLDNIKASKRGE